MPDDTFETSIEYSSYSNHALEGFGQVYSSGAYFNASDLNYANVSGNIYYYQIGSEECGDITIGIDEQDEFGYTLKPNPVRDGTFSLTADLPTQKSVVSIVSLMGKVVLRKNLQSFTNEISVHHLPKGIYIVKYEIGDEIEIRKIEIL